MAALTRRQRIGRRVIFWTAGTLVAIVLAVAVLVTVVPRTSAGQAWVRRALQGMLTDAVRGRVQVEAVEGSLIGDVLVRGVRIYDVHDDRVVAVARLEARYELWPLLVGRPVHVRTITLDGVALQLIERGGRWNLADLAADQADDDSGTSPPIMVDDLRVRRGALKVRGEQVGVRARRLVADASMVNVNGRASIDVGRLTFELVGRDLAVEEVAGSARLAADGAVVTAGRVRTGRSALDWNARMSAGTHPDYDATVDIGRLAATDLRALLGAATPPALSQVDAAGRLHLRGPAERVRLHAKLATRAGDGSLRGEVNLGAPTYAVEGRFRAVDLAAAGFGTRPTDLRGTLGFSGTGAAPAEIRGTASIALDGSSIGDVILDEASAEFELTPARLTQLTRIASSVGAARLEATLDRESMGYEVVATTDAIDLGRLFDRPALAGAVSATVRASGHGVSAAEYDVRVEGEIAASVVGGVRITDGTIAFAAVPGRLTVERLRLDADTGHLNVAGTVPLRGGPEAAAAGALEISVASDSLGRLTGIADLGGALQVEATVRGAADDLSGAVRVEGARLSFGEATAARFDGSMTVAGVDLTTDDFRPAHAVFEGTVAALVAGGRSIETLHLTSSYDLAGKGTAAIRLALDAAEAEGRVHEMRASGTVAGAVTHLDVERLRLYPGAVPWALDEPARIVLRDGGVAIENGLDLVSSEGSLRLRGHATTTANDVHVGWNDLPLAVVAPFVGFDLGGRASGTLSLGGTRAAPQLTLDAAVVEPTVAGVGYDEAHARLRVRDGNADVMMGVTEDGIARLAFEGATPLRLSLVPWAFEPGSTLRGGLTARGIDLALVDPFVPWADRLGGRVEADVTLAGSPTSPELQGTFRLIEGHARVQALGVTYDAIDVAVHLDGGYASIERLDVRSGEGVLRGEGGVGLTSAAAPTNLRFELTRFPLLGSERGRGAASGWLWLTGTAEAPVVGGALQTAGLTLRLPEESTTQIAPPDPTITVVRGPDARPDHLGLDPVRPDSEATPAPPSLYDRTAITIQIDVPRDAWLKRSDAEIELRGWTTIWKAPQGDLRAAAEIDAVRGWYTFRSKRFALVEGKVTLTGNDVDPLLELVAMHRARDYEVFVVVGGTLAKPTLRLESEPALAQADVLSVLLFGRTSAELSGGESEALQEQGVAIASSYAAQGLSQSVAGSLGLDSLQVESAGTGGVDETEVTAGKYLAEDVFVALSHRFGKETVDELRIEYQILPEWSLETMGDTLGQSSVDLFWKRRY